MWSISLINNSVKLNRKQALDLAKNSNYISIVGDYETPHFDNDDALLTSMFKKSGKTYFQLMFIPDHMEHMDYIHQISNSLKQLKVKGDITFGSMDGDNSGRFWGFRFDGTGNMKHLVGNVNFIEE